MVEAGEAIVDWKCGLPGPIENDVDVGVLKPVGD